MTTINIGGHLLEIDKPLVMGILNLTKDSFYDGGRYTDVDKAMQQVELMLSEGADIIDLGAFSSRPGAELVAAEKQIAVIKPVMEAIGSDFPDAVLSVDTFSSAVVEALAGIQPFIVNDISGAAWDEHLLDKVASLRLPYILMHIQGTPEMMQDSPSYDDVTMSVLTYLAKKLHHLKGCGIHDVIIDPGFGFGKSLSHNYELLAKLDVFKILDHPIMVGLSRKSMIYKPLGNTPESALNGTTALHMASLMKGAGILRVHDVKEAVETRNLWLQLLSHVND